MKSILGLERRLQLLERQMENNQRNGEIVDVKFDKDRKRWYVKLNDGEDLKPSGEESSHAAAKLTYKSDWLPWKSFSHGTISASVPPRKGMKATLRAPHGNPDLGGVEPYHYGPDNPSPHDKEDEVFIQVKAPESASKDETLNLHLTKDFNKIQIGSTTLTITANKVTIETVEIDFDASSKITFEGGGDGKIVLDGKGITMTGTLIQEN